jgi:hypothetical protein
VASTVLDILLGLVALAALVVAAGQLRLQRTTAGGRGLFLGADRTGHQIVRETPNGKVITNSYRVEVGTAGPKVWHELQVHLEKDGREFTMPGMPDRPETRKSMSCDSERIVWDFYLTPEDGEKVWCLVTWAEPRGPALRTDALAIALRGGSVYKWRWRWGHLYIGWLPGSASVSGGRDHSVDGESIVMRLSETAMARSISGAHRPATWRGCGGPIAIQTWTTVSPS